ncbi:MAG: type I DNA topoisomerase [Chloroflexota bacterium]
MSKRFLVIVESPGKLHHLKHILGHQYNVMASMGHVTDLPRKSFGIDVATMQPDYEVVKADVAKRLRAEAKKPYETIYLAADPDREGEAIAHHVAEILRKAKTKAKLVRVSFDAITPSAVKAAFASPRQIDTHLVDAQEARRTLDRLVGYPASRYLWEHVEGVGLSAGRVQSAALRLVTDRETAIRMFVPEAYWSITGTFRAEGGTFTAKLTQWQGAKPELKSGADAEAILTELRDTSFHIEAVTPKQRGQKPPPPFTTSTLQQTASSHLKLSPDTTMKLAQTLYEGGFITYMRTDSPAVSPEGSAMAHATITVEYGVDYIGKHRYGAKGNAQEAHECIRPTDTATTPDAVRLELGVDGAKAADLYTLIYRRFLASQTASAVYHDVHLTVVGGEAVFTTKGSRLTFDGFKRIYDLGEEKETENPDDDGSATGELPPLTTGEVVAVEALTPKEHWTKPPARFSEATLVRSLEQHGVGRPSTYAATLATLKKRGYVALEKRKLTVTPLGEQVDHVLADRLPSLFAVDFTAEMEAALDEIAAGKRDGCTYLIDFWAKAAPQFGSAVVHATLNAGQSRSVPVVDKSLGVCPKCNKPLVRRSGKHGAFIGCSGFPKCRHTQAMGAAR